jgi:hypothetical protein
MRSTPKQNRGASPAAAFSHLLERLLKVTRHEIREALPHRDSPPQANEQRHSQSGDPDCRSRTERSN